MKSLILEGIEQGFLLARKEPFGPRILKNIIDGTEWIDFATTSYLGLEWDKRLTRTLNQSVLKHGLFQYCSPIYCRPPAQCRLESTLAEIVEQESAMIFQNVTGLHAGCLPVLSSYFNALLVDEYTHQSIHDALKLAPIHRIRKFQHGDVRDMVKQLEKIPHDKMHRIMVIVDGVYSMSGRYAPISEIGKALVDYNATLYVDDSHGFGVLGNSGIDIAKECVKQSCNTIYIGSMSKAMSVPLGFIAASSPIIERLRFSANTAMFSGNVPIPFLDVAQIAVNISFGSEGARLRQQLQENREFMVAGLKEFRLGSISHGSGIVTIEFSDIELFRRACLCLHKNCIAFNPVTYPAIRKGYYRIRFCISALHRREDIEAIMIALKETKQYVR